jgi:hypothetical protein
MGNFITYIFVLSFSIFLHDQLLIILFGISLSLNCSSISHDGSLVAGGFSDSSLKVLLSYLTQHRTHHDATTVANSDLCLYRFGTWQSLDSKLAIVSLSK